MNRDSFIVICAQIVGGNHGPFETVYGFDGKVYPTRQDAIRNGFIVRGSDDFNIGVIRDGKVVSLDWMDQVVDDGPEELAAINAQVRPVAASPS